MRDCHRTTIKYSSNDVFRRGLVVCLICIAGCQETGLEKVIVEGTVSFNGTPIENGEIRFYPTEGTVGPVSGGPIVNGNYVAKAKGGVPVGTHNVQIKGFQAAENADIDESSGTMIPGGSIGPPVQFVPEQFNTKTKLTVTIEGGTERVTKDFDLKK